MTRNSVENPMVLEESKEAIHFGVDVTGDEIVEGDYILLHDGEIILESNALDYLVDFLGAEKKVAGED